MFISTYNADEAVYITLIIMWIMRFILQMMYMMLFIFIDNADALVYI